MRFVRGRCGGDIDWWEGGRQCIYLKTDFVMEWCRFDEASITRWNNRMPRTTARMMLPNTHPEIVATIALDNWSPWGSIDHFPDRAIVAAATPCERVNSSSTKKPDQRPPGMALK